MEEKSQGLDEESSLKLVEPPVFAPAPLAPLPPGRPPLEPPPAENRLQPLAALASSFALLTVGLPLGLAVLLVSAAIAALVVSASLTGLGLPSPEELTAAVGVAAGLDLGLLLLATVQVLKGRAIDGHIPRVAAMGPAFCWGACALGAALLVVGLDGERWMGKTAAAGVVIAACFLWVVTMTATAVTATVLVFKGSLATIARSEEEARGVAQLGLGLGLTSLLLLLALADARLPQQLSDAWQRLEAKTAKAPAVPTLLDEQALTQARDTRTCLGLLLSDQTPDGEPLGLWAESHLRAHRISGAALEEALSELRLATCQRFPSADKRVDVFSQAVRAFAVKGGTEADVEEWEATSQALTSLSPEDQSVLKARLKDRLTFAEIGRIRGISEAEAQARFLQARGRLVEAYQRFSDQ